MGIEESGDGKSQGILETGKYNTISLVAKIPANNKCFSIYFADRLKLQELILIQLV